MRIGVENRCMNQRNIIYQLSLGYNVQPEAFAGRQIRYSILCKFYFTN